MKKPAQRYGDPRRNGLQGIEGPECERRFCGCGAGRFHGRLGGQWRAEVASSLKIVPPMWPVPCPPPRLLHASSGLLRRKRRRHRSLYLTRSNLANRGLNPKRCGVSANVIFLLVLSRLGSETRDYWTHWGLNPGPSACEADVIPLHHVPV